MKDATRYLVVGLGGFVGANMRYLVGGWVQQLLGTGFPYGTFVINVTGCFVLGCFSTLALRLSWSDNLRMLVGIGFVGAYTTFSTFEYETLRLISEGARYRDAAANLVGSVAVGLFSAYVGVVVARLILRGRS